MKRLLYLTAIIVLTALPVVVAAQEFVPLTNLPGIKEAASSESLPSFFNNLYKLCIGAAAVIGVGPFPGPSGGADLQDRHRIRGACHQDDPQ